MMTGMMMDSGFGRNGHYGMTGVSISHNRLFRLKRLANNITRLLTVFRKDLILLAQLRQMVQRGEMNSASYVWKSGYGTVATGI